MGQKIATEEDYWTCTQGIMPARMQSIQLTVKQKDGKRYLLKTDTATASAGDFVCKWMMLLMAAIAAIVAVAIVATGGAALAVIVAAGAIAGAAGAAVGTIAGGLVCGQKAALIRTWSEEKHNLVIVGQKTLTSASMMKCPVFGAEIKRAPNIKNWWQALLVGFGNFGTTVVEGALGGAMIGTVGALAAGAATLAAPTLGTVWANVAGSFTGLGLAVRGVFGANEASNEWASGSVNNMGEAVHSFGSGAVPEAGSLKRIATGQAQPSDALLLLYFLHLKTPVKETAAPKEEEGQPKEEETNGPKPANEPEPVKEGEDGKAYEEGKDITPETVINQRKQFAYDFYKKYGMADADIANHMMGIDYTKPIEIIKVPPDGLGENGNELYQFTKVNTNGKTLRGKYYTDNPLNTPNELGISDKYNVVDENWNKTGEVKTVTQEKVIIDKPLEGLRSTSAKIDDKWSLKDQAVPTDGGGSQIYLPPNQ
jgi:hypothetical protein